MKCQLIQVAHLLKKNLNFFLVFIIMSKSKNCNFPYDLTGLPDTPVDKESEVPLELRGDSYDTPMKPTAVNGGLYSGKPVDRAHIPKPVYANGAYFTSVLLPEANPPPGAVEQTIGLNRPGNNYAPAPAVSWYQNTPLENMGPYRIKGVKGRK